MEDGKRRKMESGRKRKKEDKKEMNMRSMEAGGGNKNIKYKKATHS